MSLVSVTYHTDPGPECTSPPISARQDPTARLARLAAAGVQLPTGAVVNEHATFEPPSSFLGGVSPTCTADFGAFSYSWSFIPDVVRSIGRYCSIAAGVVFGEMQHPVDWLSTSSFTYDPGFRLWFDAARGTSFRPHELPTNGKWGGVHIAHDVWIGARAFVRGGVSIGTGAIIGTQAVVTKDVPPYAVVVGNPGCVVKYRFDEATIEALLESEWWRFRYPDFAGIDLREPRAAVAEVAERGLEPYEPQPI